MIFLCFNQSQSWRSTLSNPSFARAFGSWWLWSVPFTRFGFQILFYPTYFLNKLWNSRVNGLVSLGEIWVPFTFSSSLLCGIWWGECPRAVIYHTSLNWNEERLVDGRWALCELRGNADTRKSGVMAQNTII